MLVCRDAGPRRSLSGKVRLMVCAEEVLPPFRRGNSCFSSDRAPRRHLTGPARPAGLRGKCPPAPPCAGCLLLDFPPKASRPTGPVGAPVCRTASAHLAPEVRRAVVRGRWVSAGVVLRGTGNIKQKKNNKT